MRKIEFETELTGGRSLNLPPEVAMALPEKGKATVIVCIDMDPDDATWQKAACAQFLKDDSEADAVYDKYC